MKHMLRAVLSLIMVLALSATAWAFTDTQGLNNAQQQALDALSEQGVFSGYPDGSFQPAATITRAEFAKALCVYAGKTELKDAEAAFDDVLPGDWYYGWVSCVAEQGWINGYPGGEFRPQNVITQQEIATVLVRLSGVDVSSFAWPADYNTAAQSAGFLKDISFAGPADASRIIACQMLFNAGKEQEEKPLQTSVVRGLVTQVKDGNITIADAKGTSATYAVAAAVLPNGVIPGSYLEIEVAGEQVVKTLESVIAKKGTAYWDVALDGKSAIINDKKYDITEADIFTVEYTLNKPYSAETFVKGGVADRALLSLGGRLAAEMAVILEEDGSTLKAVYLVNASIIVSGGRLDVVDGMYSSAKGAGIYLLGRDAGLPLASGLSTPASGTFIHYTIKNGEIGGYSPLLDVANGTVNATGGILTTNNDEAPYAWVAKADGRPTVNQPASFYDVMPKVIDLGSGNRTLQLGADENNCANYWLAEGCLVYEVKNGEISQGSRSSIEKGQEVIALVNRNSEVCYLFCFI